jgi:hypothetical protein
VNDKRLVSSVRLMTLFELIHTPPRRSAYLRCPNLWTVGCTHTFQCLIILSWIPTDINNSDLFFKFKF